MASNNPREVATADRGAWQREHSEIVEELFRAKSVLDLTQPLLKELNVEAQGLEASQRACDLENAIAVVRRMLGELPERVQNLPLPPQPAVR